MATVLSGPGDPDIGTHFHKGFATAQTIKLLKRLSKHTFLFKLFYPSDLRQCAELLISTYEPFN